MLKAAVLGHAFAAVLSAAFSALAAPAFAQEAPATLLTGSVRDQRGLAPVASIIVRDAAGRIAGTARTGPDGTFAAVLTSAAASVDVRCRHCAELHATVRPGEPAVFVVTRFFALEGSAPDAADLAVLPYRDPAQALALAPFVVAVQNADGRVTALSDRGLGAGAGLVVDDGVPAYDPGTGDPGLFAFPGRSLGAATLVPASRAFTYGSYAAGGAFALSPFDDSPSGDAAFDLGQNFAFAGRVRSGDFDGAAAADRDALGVARERADAAVTQALGAATLRATIGIAAQRSGDLALDDDRARTLARVEYTLPSQRALTQFGIDAVSEHASYETGGAYPEGYSTASDAFDASLRVDRPGWLAFDYGARVRRGGVAYGGYYPPPDAVYDDEIAYVETSHAGSLGFDAGAGLARAGIRTPADGQAASETVVLPSLSANAALGEGVALRAGYSTGVRAPLSYELPADVTTGYGVQRSALQEVALDYDDGSRLKAGASFFGERTTGFAPQTLSGVGFSAAWQLAPRLSLRVWTLHDALDLEAPPALAIATLGTSPSRGVAWLSYEAPGGLRIDALARTARDATATEGDIDAGVAVPIARSTALTAGTEREKGRRRWYAGLRLR